MKLACAYSARQLLIMLEEALHKEQTQWKPYGYNNTVQLVEEVNAAQRNDIVQWFRQLNQHFHFYPETLFLSTLMLDKVLHSVKVRPKYLQCIGIACFYVAAKTLEEDEMVPSALRFVQQSGCGCSVAEVLRMERRVLDILEWDLRLVTPLDFLHIFHALLLSSMPHLLDTKLYMTPGQQLSVLTQKLQLVLMSDKVLKYPPSLVALAVLSLELQQFLPQWFAVTKLMQQHLQVTDEELICCTELASQTLGLHKFNSPSGATKFKKRSKYGTPTKKRKVADSDEDGDGDNMYDGIKRLYNDEAVTMGTCGGEHRQEDSTNTAITPLQAAAN